MARTYAQPACHARHARAALSLPDRLPELRDYFEGWYEADSVRMESALHGDLVKRSFDADGSGTLGQPRDKAQMVELTERGVVTEARPRSWRIVNSLWESSR